jgi:uncharacterized membrane protein
MRKLRQRHGIWELIVAVVAILVLSPFLAASLEFASYGVQRAEIGRACLGVVMLGFCIAALIFLLRELGRQFSLIWSHLADHKAKNCTEQGRGDEPPER